MIRKLPALLLPFLLLVFVATVSAAEDATTPKSNVREKNLLLEQKRAVVSKIKEEARVLIQAKRDEFKTRIAAIKDQKKKTLVERIDAKLADVNKNQTTSFMEVLARLQAFLDKVNGLTATTIAQANVTAAQNAIDAAKSAVEAQSIKSYVMTITDDSTLKLNAGTTVSQLRTDLMAVYKLVVDTKQAVQKLNTDKSAIKKEATNSANL